MYRYWYSIEPNLGASSGKFLKTVRKATPSERWMSCAPSLGSRCLTDGLRFFLVTRYSFSFADGLSGFTPEPGLAGDSPLVESDTLPEEPSLMEPDGLEELPNVTPSFDAVC